MIDAGNLSATANGRRRDVIRRSAPYILGRSAGADSRIEILLNEPLGTISPDIRTFHGASGERYLRRNLVGKIPKFPTSTAFARADREMKKIKASVIRYPGGCSRTATTGATASAQRTNARAGQISGRS